MTITIPLWLVWVCGALLAAIIFAVATVVVALAKLCIFFAMAMPRITR